MTTLVCLPPAVRAQVRCQGVADYGGYPSAPELPPERMGDAARKALSRATNAVRRYGWLSFWAQLTLSVVGGVILLFSVAFTSQVCASSTRTLGCTPCLSVWGLRCHLIHRTACGGQVCVCCFGAHIRHACGCKRPGQPSMRATEPNPMLQPCVASTGPAPASFLHACSPATLVLVWPSQHSAWTGSRARLLRPFQPGGLRLSCKVTVLAVLALPFRCAQSGPKASLYLTLFGILAGFLSTFWNFGYTRTALKMQMYLDAAPGQEVPKVKKQQVC